jgi:hypothetical protein
MSLGIVRCYPNVDRAEQFESHTLEKLVRRFVFNNDVDKWNQTGLGNSL